MLIERENINEYLSAVAEQLLQAQEGGCELEQDAEPDEHKNEAAILERLPLPKSRGNADL